MHVTAIQMSNCHKNIALLPLVFEPVHLMKMLSAHDSYNDSKQESVFLVSLTVAVMGRQHGSRFEICLRLRYALRLVIDGAPKLRVLATMGGNSLGI